MSNVAVTLSTFLSGSLAVSLLCTYIQQYLFADHILVKVHLVHNLILLRQIGLSRVGIADVCMTPPGVQLLEHGITVSECIITLLQPALVWA